MTDQMWHIAQDGQQVEGTHASDQVVRLVEQAPTASFLVWRQGQDQWLPPDEVAEFAALLAPPAPTPDLSDTPSSIPKVETSSAAGTQAGSTQVRQGMGFVRSLFDLRFENLVTPKMMSILYLISMILVGLGLLAMVSSGFMQVVNGIRYHAWGMAFFGLIWVVISPILAMLYLAFIRMFFEVVMVLFKIRDDLGTIARRGEG